MSYLIYGKRNGLLVDGKPVYDKTFRALDYSGKRVARLADAGEYATREDAEEKLNKRSNSDGRVDKGLVIIEIRST